MTCCGAGFHNELNCQDVQISWVIKGYLPKVVDEIVKDLHQTVEEHTRKVVQMHLLARNFANQLSKMVKELKCKEFGETLKYKNIYLAKMEDDEWVTLEQYIKGDFRKYIHNNGKVCVPADHIICLKVQCLSHFSYLKSNFQLMVLDIHGSGTHCLALRLLHIN